MDLGVQWFGEISACQQTQTNKWSEKLFDEIKMHLDFKTAVSDTETTFYLWAQHMPVNPSGNGCV